MSGDEDDDVVPVDSDTTVPLDLYRDLVCAAERARARGQHHIEPAGQCHSRPHLVHAPTVSLPRLPPLGFGGSVVIGIDETPTEGSPGDSTPSPSRRSPSASPNPVLVPMQPGARTPCAQLCAEVHLDLGPPDVIKTVYEKNGLERRSRRPWTRHPATMASKATGGAPNQVHGFPLMSASCAAVERLTDLFGTRGFAGSLPLVFGVQDPGELV